MSKTRFAFVLHNHQPIGNFDDVIERAYADSYLPFLDVIEQYPDVPFCLHTSGCLMEWFAQRRPEYVGRLSRLAARGQLEILGGGYYEPILPMIPAPDRFGQIRGYTQYLQDLLDCEVRGMWLAERVWEPSLTSDIVDAGIEYTILDDHHFHRAGTQGDSLHGSYTTEDQGRILRVFPGSEPARYMIPFRDVGEVMGYLYTIHERSPNAIVVFADDGEKFGTWPETKAHVYDHGWLHRFLSALRDSRSWLDVCTLSRAMDELPARGHVYLPDCSYREMTEWALPIDEQRERDHVLRELDQTPWGASVRKWIAGGTWRNFKVRYPETREMYARMIEVSQRLKLSIQRDETAFGDERIHEARVALYRGQCNCAYWHGAFGGLYLPHLRNAVYQSLIDADNRLSEFDSATGHHSDSCSIRDWNLDGHDEVRLSNDSLVAYIDPSHGGQIYELDVRNVAVNLGATLARRPEAYHEWIRNLSSTHQEQQHATSIHERVRCKHGGLDQKLSYDSAPRRLLVDRVIPVGTTFEDARMDRWTDIADFSFGSFQVDATNEDVAPSVAMRRTGSVHGRKITLEKTIALSSSRGEVRAQYQLSNLPTYEPIQFAVEMNIASLASGADDRYVCNDDGSRLGRIGDSIQVLSTKRIDLLDDWLGLEVGIVASKCAQVWLFPTQTVSQSEDGFELVHQCYRVVYVWKISSGESTWKVGIDLVTTCKRNRRHPIRTEPIAHAAVIGEQDSISTGL